MGLSLFPTRPPPSSTPVTLTTDILWPLPPSLLRLPLLNTSLLPLTLLLLTVTVTNMSVISPWAGPLSLSELLNTTFKTAILPLPFKHQTFAYDVHSTHYVQLLLPPLVFTRQ